MEFSYQIKIPLERVAVLIGKNGETKAELEKLSKSNLKIDSDEGTVAISGKDSLNVYIMRNVVLAIARGFNPELARYLLKTDYALEMLNLQDYAKPSQQERLKGRVIGAKGKSRSTIESLTETYISVYGKTIGIIGEVANAQAAKNAIVMLLEGSLHKTVYSMLERWRREQKKF